jgi:hypothetical protein
MSMNTETLRAAHNAFSAKDVLPALPGWSLPGAASPIMDGL